MADDDGFDDASINDGAEADYNDEPVEPELEDGLNENDPEEEVVGTEHATKVEKVEPSMRRTTKFMTKYERARILGTRALQISLGAPVMVEVEDGVIDPLVIARKELREQKIPITVRRYLPDGSYEDWNVDELIVEE
mmetsp:Transcript_11010/g.29585  ORF Transcript_11010/g.29585 Transcript_11010/m.29585 type:complete len:137 (-) Transcript_11010:65-475(-)|eukprot:CAMPEP_0185831544 /NCGR_PEP_ID=MMETSP1353-20130828/1557_1 /TAXON_ID=1077150 /ORGANISM="Erythrolobus australicus, Strain CCMP3124" /LENGTH=136 /DNA_ID=CAMNT_0028529615 /DNA_START=36 /DNA_END=446 /DNA_ORIENTATION=-